jgi:hypothetical protein
MYLTAILTAEALAGIILVSLSRSPAQAGIKDKYGQRWVTYNEIIGLNGRSAVVTIVWIFKSEAVDVPVLVTCYIELKEQEKLRRLLEGG